MDDPLRNLKDPLHKSGPDAGKELFRRMVQVAHGFPNEAVLNAAANLLINPIRQNCDSWAKAEPVFNEWFGRTKQILRDHYDANLKRKNIFPYDQVVQMPLFDARTKKNIL